MTPMRTPGEREVLDLRRERFAKQLLAHVEEDQGEFLTWAAAIAEAEQATDEFEYRSM